MEDGRQLEFSTLDWMSEEIQAAVAELTEARRVLVMPGVELVLDRIARLRAEVTEQSEEPKNG